jgi:N-acetylglucosaminyl-diphospho-decaprenol L-rhamnosyltransferase
VGSGWGAAKDKHVVTASPPSIDVSVVIVSWNTRDLLLRCLESLKAEAARSRLYVEVFVVDNASADGSVEAVNENFPDVTVLAQSENLGFAAANNLAIDQATGTALLLLNPDTEMRPGSLRTLWTTLHAGQHVGLVAPILLNPDGSLQSAGYRFPGLTQTILDIFPLHPYLMESGLNGRFDRGDGLSPFEIDHPLGACMLVRREVIDAIGGLDNSFYMYSEEIDWCQRIKSAGWTILMAPAAEVTHYGGRSTSQVADRMQEQLHRSRAAYLRRYQSERFHRTLNTVLRAGLKLHRYGVPIPTADRSVQEIARIASIYQETGRGDA